MAQESLEHIQRLIDSLDTFLPPYLSQFDREKLKEALSQFPNNMNYYLSHRESEFPLQGDGWRGFVVYDYEDEKTLVDRAGIIFSNSCDINPDNARDINRAVIFAPLSPLHSYVSALEDRGVDGNRIKDLCSNIREQRITDLFYLPSVSEEIPEALVSMDTLHSLPRPVFDRAVTKHLFTLSMYGFYLFLLKISIHFTRVQEGIRRM